jgi:hypothetical protein
MIFRKSAKAGTQPSLVNRENGSRNGSPFSVKPANLTEEAGTSGSQPELVQ